MTGYHKGHNEKVLRSSDFVPPELFKIAGYRTGMFGKWGLGGVGYGGYPTQKGWDTFVGLFSRPQALTYYPDMLLGGDLPSNSRATGAAKRSRAPPLSTSPPPSPTPTTSSAATRVTASKCPLLRITLAPPRPRHRPPSR